jgi:hypothetical protein
MLIGSHRKGAISDKCHSGSRAFSGGKPGIGGAASDFSFWLILLCDARRRRANHHAGKHCTYDTKMNGKSKPDRQVLRHHALHSQCADRSLLLPASFNERPQMIASSESQRLDTLLLLDCPGALELFYWQPPPANERD